MGRYRCRCPLDEEGRVRDGVHDDRCPAGELQDWAGRMLDAERKTASCGSFGGGPIRCEKCGLPIERETREDTEGYLWTGRCRACRAGRRADFIGFVENLLGVPPKGGDDADKS